MRAHILVTITVAVLLSAAGAAAQPSTGEDASRVEEARSQYRAGVQAFQRGRFGEATIAFERSFRARPHPATLYNAAEARMRAGDQTGALEQLRELLAMTTPPPEADLVTRARGLASQMGESDLRPATSQTTSCPECPTCPPQQSCPPAPPPSVVERRVNPLAWGLAGGAIVLFGLGAGFYAVAVDNAATYRAVETPRSLQTDLRDQGEAYRLIGLTGMLLGAGAAAGAVWLFTHPREADTERRAGTRLNLAVGPSGLVLGGTF